MNSEEFEKMFSGINAVNAETAKKLQLSPPTISTEHSVDCGDDPFSHQVGGSHYKQYTIQPYEFFYKNNIPHHKAAIIRRILRFDHPTGKGMTDLDKIIHEVELIKKLWGEENVTPSDKD